MEAFFILLIGAPLVALALLGHIGFFLAIGARRRLRELELQFGLATQRIAVLERAAAPAPPTEAAAEPERPVAAAEPAPVAPASETAPPKADAPEPAAAATAPRPAPDRSLEETLGARWTVWVGGVALALGAALMVRWSIENGLFGPSARISLGLGFSGLLLVVGEILRRGQGALLEGSAAARANAPAALTGAGVVGAFASVYAAHALYGFLDATFAFVVLGVVSFAALLLASLHGPALAGLGLLGALATPLLISSEHPSPWPAVLYLGVVGAANQVMARLRRWLWLALAAAAGGLAWTWLIFDMALKASSTDIYHAALACLALHAALAAGFLAVAPHRDAPEDQGAQDPFALGALALHAAVGLVLLNAAPAFAGADAVWLAAAALLVGVLAVAGSLSTPTASAAALAGLAALGALCIWPAAVAAPRPGLIDTLAQWRWPAPADPRAFVTYALIVGLGLAALALARVLAARRLALLPAALLAGAATLTPLGALMIADVRLSEGRASAEMATVAALLAALFVGAARLFQRRLYHGGPGFRLGLGALASAAIGALACGLVFALDGALLTVALALSALGTAFVAIRLEIPALRWAVAGIGVLVGARLAWEPRVVGAALSPTPVFNWLLVGYGVPALAFGLAARLMRRRGEDTAVRIADALAVLFAAFLVFFEVRHYTNGGDPYARDAGLVELGLQAVSAFGFGLVLTRLDAARANPVFRWASLAAGVLGALVVGFGLFVVHNPFLANEAVEGGRVVNALLIAYLLPAALAGALALAARGVRPRWYTQGAGWLAALLAAGYVALEARVLTHGPHIDVFHDFTIVELGIDASAALLAALALDLIGWRGRSRLAFVVAAVVGAVGLAGLSNPLWSGRSVGDGLVFNALFAGYLVPAVLATALARRARRAEMRVTAILWIFAYVTLETRRVFQSPKLDLGAGFLASELYAYSAIWLGLGLALLVYGVRRGAREVRLASAFFVFASTAKVFLVDFSGLEGMYRAMSFIGLGAALIGIGLVYQKLVFAPRPPPLSPG